MGKFIQNYDIVYIENKKILRKLILEERKIHKILKKDELVII